MAWFVLVVAGVLEAVWAVALGKSDGFTRLTPSVVFLIAIAASMAGLGFAMRTLPIGTAYAVWVGIGAALTARAGLSEAARAETKDGLEAAMMLAESTKEALAESAKKPAK